MINLDKIIQYFESRLLVSYYILDSDDYRITIIKLNNNSRLNDFLCHFDSDGLLLNIAFTPIEKLYAELNDDQKREFISYIENNFKIEIDGVHTKLIK